MGCGNPGSISPTFYAQILQIPKAQKNTVKPWTSCAKFHQHFTHAFYANILVPKISTPKHSFVIFGTKILYKKLGA